MIPSAARIAPQQIDPLSWFTRPLIALSFAGVIVVYGLGSILIEWEQLAHPRIESVSVLLFAGACVYIQERTKPFRRRFGLGATAVVLVMASAGIGLSAWANIDSTVLVQYWWAPAGVALVIGTLGPFSSSLRILAAGTVLTIVTGIGGWVAFAGDDAAWPALSAALIGVSTVLVGVTATSVFCFVVVSRTRALLAGAGGLTAADKAELDAADDVERHIVARLGARVAPFLEKLADAGVVTDEDRALAGQLARRLRRDLLEQQNRSWLDSLALRGRMFVVDPDRRADHLNQAQRAALRGLLRAALRNPATDADSLFVELRGRPDGSTDVALSLDIDLPEGRRARMLAPYYLALQTTVDDVSYDRARDLLRFEVRAGAMSDGPFGPSSRRPRRASSRREAARDDDSR